MDAFGSQERKEILVVQRISRKKIGTTISKNVIRVLGTSFPETLLLGTPRSDVIMDLE
jgi:hypothetical protein